MKYYLKLGFILLFITALASGILAYLDDITKPIIAASQNKAQVEARKEVLPTASFFEKDSVQVELKIDSNPLKIQRPKTVAWFDFYRGLDADKKLVGYTFQATKYGYSSSVKTMVGVNKDFIIQNIQVVSQAETPGLGAKCIDESFKEKYVGKELAELKVDKDGGEIASITGATITTRSITESVQEALAELEKVVKNSDLQKEEIDE